MYDNSTNVTPSLTVMLHNQFYDPISSGQDNRTVVKVVTSHRSQGTLHFPIVHLNVIIHFRQFEFVKFPADLVTFTEEIHNGKLYFLYSIASFSIGYFIC